MWRFILATFAILGWSFYTLSGGADYQPREGSRQAAALKAEAEQKLQTLAPQVTVSATLPPDSAAHRAKAPDAPARDLLALDTSKLLPGRPAPSAATAPAATPGKPTPAPGDSPLPPADARVANLSLAQPAAFAQAAGYAPSSVDDPARTQAQDQTSPQTQPDVATTDRIPDLRQITGTRVNMRAGPGTGYDVVTSLLRDTEVEVLEQDENGWLRLRVLQDSTVGWVSPRLVTAATE